MSDKLNQLLRPVVEDLGYEFIGIEHSSNPKNALLRIYIDQEPDGVVIEDCAEVSREVSAILDVEDPIGGEYRLEVSSPGLDRPLFTPAHYQQFVGHKVRLKLYGPIEGRRKYLGNVLAANDDSVTVDQDGTAVEIPYDSIAGGRLEPDYDALMRSNKS